MDKPDLKLSTQDYALRMTKVALGAVPYVGGLLGELLDIAVYPQQQKKLNEWFEFVEATLNKLIEQGAKTRDQIFSDEEFVSIFQKTSRIYSSNVEEHKKPILQAYLKASITKQIPLDKKYIFLKIIDELTETQLLILKDVYENEKSENRLFAIPLDAILVEKYASGDNQYLALLNKGLQDFNLLSYGQADVVIDGTQQWNIGTSHIGKDFIEYLLTD